MCMTSDFFLEEADEWRDEAWENVMFNVTCENQKRADERIPILLELPFRHKGIMCAPFIGPVSIEKYLPEGQIEQVLCDGENYGGARPCHYEWVKSLHDECFRHNVTSVFCGTGRLFVKDGKVYKLESNRSGLSFQGKKMEFRLTDEWGYPLEEEQLYQPYFGERCQTCGMKIICNGCSQCEKCQNGNQPKPGMPE